MMNVMDQDIKKMVITALAQEVTHIIRLLIAEIQQVLHTIVDITIVQVDILHMVVEVV